MAGSYERRMLRVIDHIHDNPAGDLSLDALAEVAAMSRFHWHRVFQGLTGETVTQCVRRMRMQRAAVMLAQGDPGLPLTVVAARVGYPNRSSFVRAFTDSFGMAPSVFRKRDELRPFTNFLTRKVSNMSDVALRIHAARSLAAVAHSGAYHEIGRAFEKLSAVMASRDLFRQAGAMVGVYYDNPSLTPAPQLRSHAGFEVPAKVALAAPLTRVTLAAGKHAVLTHCGPYAGLPAAYDELFGVWLPQSGHEAADAPAFEVYLNTPMDTAAEDLLTELWLPLLG